MPVYLCLPTFAIFVMENTGRHCRREKNSILAQTWCDANTRQYYEKGEKKRNPRNLSYGLQKERRKVTVVQHCVNGDTPSHCEGSKFDPLQN